MDDSYELMSEWYKEATGYYILRRKMIDMKKSQIDSAQKEVNKILKKLRELEVEIDKLDKQLK